MTSCWGDAGVEGRGSSGILLFSVRLHRRGGAPRQSWEEHPPPASANGFTEADQPTPLSARGTDCSGRAQPW